MCKSKFTEEQILAILKEQEAGMSTADVCRKHGISPASFYKYKAKFGGMEVFDARRLKVLEDENAKLRKLLAETMLDVAIMTPSDKPYFAHQTACIDDGTEIGAGTKIWHFSHIMPDSVIGECCNIGQNVVVSPGCCIGNNVKIQNNVSIYTGVILEDDVFCGPSMVFTNVINPRSHVERKDEYKQSLVRKGASIGANATVICGCTLGAYCFIGAGAVVTRDVPNFALIVGNPGRLRGFVCICGEKLSLDVDPDRSAKCACTACGKRYRKSGTVVELLETES